MPHNLLASGGALGALPARFRRPRLLIVGCGDVGVRVVRALSIPSSPAPTAQPPHPRLTVRALTSSPSRVPALRALGVTPLQGNLDTPATLRRLAGIATHVLHLAPPPSTDGLLTDPRTARLLRALRRGWAPTLVYGSTTGVYGDQGGRWIDETARPGARTARARRRVNAEQHVRFYARGSGVRASVLRIPGIYAPDREGGTPEARLRRGTPVLQAGDDVYTNHIHADDLARALVAALWHGAPLRVYHASDDTELKMGDYFDFAADRYGLPRPPRISRTQAQAQLPPTLLSFMSESRRLRNDRLKRELGVRLRYPTVVQGLN